VTKCFTLNVTLEEQLRPAIALRFGHNFDIRINQRITSAPMDEVRVKGLVLQRLLAHRFRRPAASNG